ncbi:MAG: hypothetical protein QW360_03530 [Thermofilum sp.]
MMAAVNYTGLHEGITRNMGRDARRRWERMKGVWSSAGKRGPGA